MNNDMVYLVVYEFFSRSNFGGGWTNIIGTYHKPKNAVAFVRMCSEQILAESEDDNARIKIVYDRPYANWPWLFTWEDSDGQYTYKVVPHKYDDEE